MEVTSSEPAQQSTRTPWQLVAVSVMGAYWGINYVVPAVSHRSFGATLGWLPLLGFLTPLLLLRKRLWRRIAIGLCSFEAALAPLLWWNSMIHFMDPMGFHVRVFGIAVGTVWSPLGQFVYFGLKGLAFIVAIGLILSVPAIRLRANASGSSAPSS